MLFQKWYNRWFSPHKIYVNQLRHLMGFTPVNIAVYRMAFRHASRTTATHTTNERLEYLGDSVLGTAVSEFLFKKYPLKGEGFLTEMRSKIVRRKKLGEIGYLLDLSEFLDYDHLSVHVTNTLLGNALEALVGAIYLDAGYDKAQQFVYQKILAQFINIDRLETGDLNYKSLLLEWAQKHAHTLDYELVDERITGNTRRFTVAAYVNNEELGRGEGPNKKEAEKQASKAICETLSIAKQMGIIADDD